MDYSKLSDKTLQALSNGKSPDFSSLTDEELQELAGPPSTAKVPQTSLPNAAKDFGTGVAAALPSKTVAGAAQAIPDYLQSKLHNLVPSTIPESVSQTGEKLKQQGFTGDTGPSSTAQLYDQARQEQGDTEDAARKRSPYSFGTGQVVGGMLPMALTGPSVAAGAALGAAQGLDKTKANYASGDSSQRLKAAIDTMIGGGVGAGGAYAGNKIAGMINPDVLANAASNRAAAALGVKASRNAQKNIGQTVLENNSLPIFGGSEAIQDAIQGAKQNVAETGINPTLAKIQQGLPEVAQNDLGQKALGVFEDFSKKMSNRSDGPQIVASIRGELENYAPQLAEAGNDIQKLNAMKQGMQAQAESAYTVLANGKKQPTPKSELYLKLASEIQKHIEDLGNQAGPDLGKTLSEANASYGNLKEAGQAATKLVDKDASRSATGHVMGPLALGATAGAALLNPALGATTALATEGAQLATGHPISRLANIVAARGANAASKVAETLGTGTPEAQFLGAALPANVLSNPSTIQGAQKMTPAIQKALPAVNSNPSSQPKISTPSGSNASNNQILNTGHSLYNANDEQLQFIGNKIAELPGQQSTAAALHKAIARNDSQSKNAVLFSIMQNPSLRSFLNKTHDESEENGEEV